MPQIITLQPVPNQTVATTVGGQAARLNIYQFREGLFMDVLLGVTLVIGGVLCENANLIVRDLYFGFDGDFSWIDTQGTEDPYYTGIGERFFLSWLTPSDVQTVLASYPQP